MKTSPSDTVALGDVAAGRETALSLICTAGALAVNTRGGRRPGAGRKPLPLSRLTRPDLKDRRKLKKARPNQ
ncbi:MAG: hypothetical protein V1724_05730 [Chloroflexota bacterium]